MSIITKQLYDREAGSSTLQEFYPYTSSDAVFLSDGSTLSTYLKTLNDKVNNVEKGADGRGIEKIEYLYASFPSGTLNVNTVKNYENSYWKSNILSISAEYPVLWKRYRIAYTSEPYYSSWNYEFCGSAPKDGSSFVDITSKYARVSEENNNYETVSNLASWENTSPTLTKEFPHLWKKVLVKAKLEDGTVSVVSTNYEYCGSLGQSGIDAEWREWIFTVTSDSGSEENIKSYLQKLLEASYSDPSYQANDFVPLNGNWHDDMIPTTAEEPLLWCAGRYKKEGTWGKFANLHIFGRKATNGVIGNNIYAIIDSFDANIWENDKKVLLDELEFDYQSGNITKFPTYPTAITYNWLDNIPRTDPTLVVYSATAYFSEKGCVKIDAPIRITGPLGPGSDGENIEFAYFTTEDPDINNCPNLPNTAEPVTNTSLDTWFNCAGDHPISLKLPYLFMIQRLGKYEDENNWYWNYKGVHYGKSEKGLLVTDPSLLSSEDKSIWNYGWSKPVLLSSWGLDGIDGDGVQYVYLLLTLAEYDWILLNGWNISLDDSDTKEDPTAETYPTTIINKTAKVWTDDPTGVNIDYIYEFCCSRRYTYISKDSTKKAWQNWSVNNIALWSHYGRDGFSTSYSLSLSNDSASFAVDFKTNLKIVNTKDNSTLVSFREENILKELQTLKVGDDTIISNKEITYNGIHLSVEKLSKLWKITVTSIDSSISDNTISIPIVAYRVSGEDSVGETVFKLIGTRDLNGDGVYSYRVIPNYQHSSLLNSEEELKVKVYRDSLIEGFGYNSEIKVAVKVISKNTNTDIKLFNGTKQCGLVTCTTPKEFSTGITLNDILSNEGAIVKVYVSGDSDYLDDTIDKFTEGSIIYYYTGECEEISWSAPAGLLGIPGEKGNNGAIYRCMGEWQTGKLYVNNNLFIDYVSCGKTAEGLILYYSCKKTHTNPSQTSNKPGTTGGNTYWEKFVTAECIATGLLNADLIVANTLTTLEATATKAAVTNLITENLTAEKINITEGEAPNISVLGGFSKSDDNSPIIWSGGSGTEKESKNNATFKVFKDGTLECKNGIFGGVCAATSMKLTSESIIPVDITLPGLKYCPIPPLDYYTNLWSLLSGSEAQNTLNYAVNSDNYLLTVRNGSEYTEENHFYLPILGIDTKGNLFSNYVSRYSEMPNGNITCDTDSIYDLNTVGIVEFKKKYYPEVIDLKNKRGEDLSDSEIFKLSSPLFLKKVITYFNYPYKFGQINVRGVINLDKAGTNILIKDLPTNYSSGRWAPSNHASAGTGYAYPSYKEIAPFKKTTVEDINCTDWYWVNSGNGEEGILLLDLPAYSYKDLSSDICWNCRGIESSEDALSYISWVNGFIGSKITLFFPRASDFTKVAVRGCVSLMSPLHVIGHINGPTSGTRRNYVNDLTPFLCIAEDGELNELINMVVPLEACKTINPLESITDLWDETLGTSWTILGHTNTPVATTDVLPGDAKGFVVTLLCCSDSVNADESIGTLSIAIKKNGNTEEVVSPYSSNYLTKLYRRVYWKVESISNYKESETDGGSINRVDYTRVTSKNTIKYVE